RPISRKSRSQTLVRSTSTRATLPASSRACSSYRKSVTSRSSDGVRTTIPAEPLNPVRYRTFARAVTNSASRPCAARDSVSACRRAGRRSAGTTGREMRHEPLEAEPVTIRAESRDHADRRVGEQGAAALGLAGEDVGQMHFDERHPDRQECIPDRKTRVRERRGIHERAVGRPFELLDGVDQLAFMVGLAENALDAKGAGAFLRSLLDLTERHRSVDLRLSLPQQIEIRPIQYRDAH